MIRGLTKALPRPYPNYVVHSIQYQTTGPTGPTRARGPTHNPPSVTHTPTDMQVLLASGDIWKPQSHSKNKKQGIKADN